MQQTQGGSIVYPLDAIAAQYKEIKNTSPDEMGRLYTELFKPEPVRRKKPDQSEISEMLETMNKEGAWVENIQIWDYTPGDMIEGKKTLRGFSLGTYISHMRKMLDNIKE